MHRNQAIPLDGMETGMGLRTVRSFPYRNQAIPLDGMETWGTLPVPSHIFL